MTILGDAGQGTQQSQGQQGGQQGSGQSGSTNSQGGQSGGSASQTTWRDSLPDELKTNTALQQFTSIEGLAKSYLETKAHVGKKGVIVPGQNASDEEWTRFYRDLGQPEIEKFEVKTPEGKQVNKDFVGKFKELAHKTGLLPKQAQALIDWYSQFEDSTLGEMKKQQELAIKQGLDGLRKEWGQGYDKELARGELAIKELGIEGMGEWLTKTGLNKDAMMIRVLNAVGKMYGEDRLRGDGGGGRFGNTPRELQQKIDTIMGNKSHPYWDRNHPGHKAAVAEVEELWKSKTMNTA